MAQHNNQQLQTVLEVLENDIEKEIVKTKAELSSSKRKATKRRSEPELSRNISPEQTPKKSKPSRSSTINVISPTDPLFVTPKPVPTNPSSDKSDVSPMDRAKAVAERVR